MRRASLGAKVSGHEQEGAAMRYMSSISTYLVLLLLLATVPGSTAGAVAFGLVLTAVVVTVVATTGRDSLTAMLFGVTHGPAADQRRRGAFRRQDRPNEAGRPMPRAPGALVGAL
ncbi:hypothetical protein C5142_07245 [Rhodococcus sp. BGS-1C]